jgi:hypothetical protein
MTTDKDAERAEAMNRLAEARRDLESLEREIAPFTKPRERRSHSTAGQWQDTRVALRRHRETPAN